jgi:hypothetical protein
MCTIKNLVKSLLLGLFGDKVGPYFVEISRIAICGLKIKNFGFFYLRTAIPKKFADLDCGMSSRISGFAICGL